MISIDQKWEKNQKNIDTDGQPIKCVFYSSSFFKSYILVPLFVNYSIWSFSYIILFEMFFSPCQFWWRDID